MNKFKLLLTTVAASAFFGTAKAQMSGTYSVPATYSTIGAAIADLNSQGVNGPVTILVNAGHTETASVGGYYLTATGTSVNPIIFQKNGTGANPLITAYTGTATPTSAGQDGVWRLIGSDYITINGIDITDPNTTNPGTMEFGYGLFKQNAANGCQNNTIQNCVITLNNINNVSGTAPATDGSRGIDVVNALPNAHTSIVTVTAASGANSDNKFYSNTIQNCNIGIALIGFAAATPFTNADQGNDVGGSSASTGNTIINYGGGPTTGVPCAGVRTLAQYNINVSYNYVNNNNGSGLPNTSTLRGIYLNTATSANATVNNNTITLNSGTVTSQVSAIENVSGSTPNNNLITISNNLIANGTGASASATYYGIYNFGASSASLVITNNTFTNNSIVSTSGSSYLIRNTGAVGSYINISNNNFDYAVVSPAASSRDIYNIYTSGTGTTSVINITNNNFLGYTHAFTGTGDVYFIYNSRDAVNMNISANNASNLTLNHSGLEYFMYNPANITSSLSVISNTFNNVSRTGAFAGDFYGYYSITATSGNSSQTFSNNLFANYTATTPGSGIFYGINNTGGGTSPYPKKTITGNTIANINIGITGSFYGIYADDLGDGGTTSGSAIFNNTINNITSGGTMYGLYTASPGSPTYATAVYSNTLSNFTGNGASSSVHGAYIGSGGAGVNFYKNRIYGISTNGVSGIANGIYAITSTTSNIYNNLIGNITAPSSGGLNRVNGIFAASGTNLNFFYNTVYLNGTSTGTDFGTNAIYTSTSITSVTLRNNIFVNLSTATGTGVASAYRRNGTSLLNYNSASNDNLFYAGTPGPNNLIFTDGTNNYQSLSTFISAFAPAEASSITENPNFVSTAGTSANFLNINTVTPTQIESSGAAIAGITDDYIGAIRSATPDIGAWEGNYTLAQDMSAPTFLQDGFTSPACNLSSRTYTINMSDVSGIASGSLSPRVYYSVNGGPYTSNQGTLTSGAAINGVWTFSLSYTANVGDVISYFVVAQDIAPTPNLGALPGGGFAGVDVNNVTTNPTSPFTYSVSTALGGSYTVGTAGTFTTLSAAANAYNLSCLTSSVTFVLSDPIYSANETFPIVFLNNQDASSTNSLLVMPGSGITSTIITASPVSSTIRFLDARFINFDGVNTGGAALTVANTHTSTSAVLWIASSNGGPGNKNITLKNLNVVGSGTLATRHGILAGQINTTPSTTSGVDNDFVTISNNTITNVYYGIYATGTSSLNAGGINNWIINQNVIGGAVPGTGNVGYRAIFISEAPGIVISNNLIRNIYSTGSASGIYLSGDIIGGSVTQNTINEVYSSTTSTGLTTIMNGLYMGPGVASTTVSGNTISGIENTSASGYGARGLQINVDNGSSNYVRNNMISEIRGGRTTAIYWPIGIALEGSSGGVTLDYNSVNLGSSHAGVSTATASAAMYINTTGSVNIVRNNILSNMFDNTTITSDVAYAIYSSAANGTNISTMDYNNYYSGGTGNIPMLGFVASANQSSLPSLQAGFGGNVNSKNFAPVFVSASDLHLQPVAANSPFDGFAIPVTGITVDIDNQVRNVTTPDIGADEFSSPTCTSAVAGTITPSAPLLCNGQTLNLSSSGTSLGATTSYQWMFSTTAGGPYTNVTGGNGANTPSLVTGALSTGTLYYVLQVGCAAVTQTTSSNEATVVINPVPTASVSPSTTLCEGQTLNLTASSDIGTNYSWSGPGAFSSTVQNPAINNIQQSASGNYTLTVSAANCTAAAVTTSITVNKTNVYIDANPTAICAGGSATLTAIGTQTSILWSNGATTNSIVVTPATTTQYSISATGTTACSASAFYTLVVNNPTITATGTLACGTPTATGTLTAVGFGPVSWYSSPTSTTAIGTGSTYVPAAVSTNTTVYAEAVAFTSKDSLFTLLSGTSSFMGEMFDIVALNQIEVKGFDVNFTGLGTAVVEVWYRPGSFVGFETSNTGWTLAQTTTVNTLGSGSLTPLGGGISVNIPAGQTYGFYIVSTSGPLARYSTTTAAVGSVLSQNTDVQLLVGNSGQNYFSVTTTKRAFNGEVQYRKVGCLSARVPVTLTVVPTPTVTLSASSTSICTGNSSTITASGAPSYSWSPVTSTSSIVTVTPAASTVYSVTGIDNGCSSTETINITVNNFPTVTISASNNTICAGNTTTLTANGASSYTWNTSATTSVIAVNPSSTTAYTVTGDASGCTATDVVTVTVNSLPNVSLTASQTTVCVNGPTVTLSGSPSGGIYTGGSVSSGVFTPGSTSGTFTPTYSYTDASTGCSNSATTTIIVSACTGLDKSSSSLNGLTVYPNPNAGQFTIELNNGLEKTVEVSDLTGRIILNTSSVNSKINIDINEFANGVYFVKVRSNNTVEIIKVVKQ